ncbi:hypothetical protein F3Y22_tig00110307pilonHSYRG00059 [Hibiscus syriacus]|uniref:Uncharacterized protein n=1 Tax=Hibiscus syriacus TaxID=106335 RepID=A0A6A3B2X2_HIBSY|nr:hypothetical protein F3Y22_tig00110307pilonHSYRG00059 [Hibiscus syriacus]
MGSDSEQGIQLPFFVGNQDQPRNRVSRQLDLIASIPNVNPTELHALLPPHGNGELVVAACNQSSGLFTAVITIGRLSLLDQRRGG